MGPERGGTLGVVGTLVWDRVVPADGGAGVEGWGGIAYGLSGAIAALGRDWTVRPIVRVGADLADEATGLLGALPGIDASAVLVVPEPNNRVELRYRNDSERVERLTGGVGGWEAAALRARVDGCDALLVNFISGFEMTLAVAEELRAVFAGPVYADLHSLFLGLDADGTRVARPLDRWRRWCACFDAVQTNELEFGLLAPSMSDDERCRAVLSGCRLLTVTLGARGARVTHRAGEVADPRGWRTRPEPGGGLTVHDVRLPGARRGDPTGCGDVWGGAMFGSLLAGASLSEAAVVANRLAARSVEHAGVVGLVDALRAERAGSGVDTAWDAAGRGGDSDLE